MDGMSAPLDWLRSASDPRVVAVVLARYENHHVYVQVPRIFRDRLGLFGITATEDQARALLEAVDACDAMRGSRSANLDALREDLTAAVTAIVGPDRG